MLNVYSVFDTQAQTYNVPFFMKKDGQALRAFIDITNDPKTDIHKHPTDYVLFRLGSFDDESGVISPCEAPQRIANAWELLDGVNNENS